MDPQQVLVDCLRLTEKHGGKPSIIGTIRMARIVGAVFDDKWARTLLRKFTQVSPDSTQTHPPVATGLPTSTLGAPRKMLGTRARGKGIPSTNPSESVAPLRRVRLPRELPEIPADLIGDVDDVVANDAGDRHDGKIADTVVAELLLRVRRAIKSHGEEAVRAGIAIALDKGKGIAYAAGCAKNYRPAERPARREPPQLSLGPAIDLLDDSAREAIARKELARRAAAGES